MKFAFGAMREYLNPSRPPRRARCLTRVLTIPAVALCGGVALYLLGHNAFRLRELGSLSVSRVVVTVLCLALMPVAVSIPSLVILAILAGLMCALVAFETMRSRELRRELRVQ